MKTVLIINAKGGVGKTTVSVNLAGYYAAKRKRVHLIELDPQGSTLDWLKRRPTHLGRIWSVDGVGRSWSLSERRTDYAIIDAPAAVGGSKLSALLRRADAVVVPVLPSPIDIKALDGYLKEIRKACAAAGINRRRIGILANKMRSNTNISAELHRHLSAMPYTYLTALRDSTNYIHCFNVGVSVFEYRPSLTAVDRKEWRPVIKWIG